ncbi:hypothetical protein PHLGIDRAFT_24877 [Phlebiopsis gigantea 11061_1 CR5-6]|uniref:Uncharacterized protein n=1 Tax=Phlebiopsis gigantea (strain 11061_1 CR5-6) TaxID=745531 RepID=A0A0C3RWD8_PHLG1|nr:hypothetical protein PHLGIDRAFT_24877 [Phlebiopsis gigantea 11061_1 CR5-6]
MTSHSSVDAPVLDTPSSLSQHTEDNIDDLLSIFNDLPAGELDALLDSTDFSTIIPEDFDFTSLFDTAPVTQTPIDAPPNQSGDLVIPETQPSEPTDTNVNTTTSSPMFVIDPELLALSTPIPPLIAAPSCNDVTARPERPHIQTTNVTSSSMGSGAPPTPTLVGSPLSQVDFDPPTPNWDFPFLEPEIVGNEPEGTSARASSESGNDSEDVGGGGLPKGRDKGKGRAVEVGMTDEREDMPMIVGPPSIPALLSATSLASSRASSSSAPSIHTTTPNLPTHLQGPAPFNPLDVLEPLRKTLEALLPQPSRVSSLLVAPPAVMQSRPSVPTQVKDRDEILRRARLMRQQLAEEIERAKIELWETTMEGGCLAVLAKERDKSVVEKH